MNHVDHLERDLTVWFEDTATPRVPDFTDDILQRTAGTRQRPRWSFPERWLPMSVITLGRQTFKPLPWRTIGLLAVLATLIAASIAAFIGSQPRLPAPFGLAANGLVAYARGGDIYAVDPVSGARMAIATGPEIDQEPRWSLDGTRLAFLRDSVDQQMIVIVDPIRPDEPVTTAAFTDLDGDTVAWSPDGRSISFRARHDGSSAIFIADATTGQATPLAIDVAPFDVYWRPPDGRQLMVFGVGADPSLHLYSFDDQTIVEVKVHEGSGPLRANGWMPDGQRFVYQRGEYDQPPIETYVLDVVTGNEITIDVGYGHVSNDGTRMVALDATGRMCVVELTGGPCRHVGEISQSYGGPHAMGVQWSPDDERLISRPPGGDGGIAFLVDPDGAILAQPAWIADGAGAWQRVAP
jgi:Tol biopolymer transport system component